MTIRPLRSAQLAAITASGAELAGPSLSVNLPQAGPDFTPAMRVMSEALTTLPFSTHRELVTDEPVRVAREYLREAGGELVSSSDRAHAYQGKGWVALLAQWVGEWNLTVAGDTFNTAARLAEAVSALATPPVIGPDGTIPLTVWTESLMGGGMSRYCRATIGPWTQVAGNYPTATREPLEQLMAKLPERDAGGLVVFCGTAGTGKTRAMEALLHAYGPEADLAIVADADRLLTSAAYLTDVLSYAADRRQVVVAEDCDDLVAEGPKNASVAKLLNVADGLLGRVSGMGTLMILTANLDPDQLASYVKRPGRAVAVVDFVPFPPDEANVWLSRYSEANPEHATGLDVQEPMTLADLYAVVR